MRDVTLVILNSLRIKCHIRRPLNRKPYPSDEWDTNKYGFKLRQRGHTS